jgi:hypothetical protein
VTVKIAGTFSRETRDDNGLEEVKEQLINQPLERVLVAGLVETKTVTTDVANGSVAVPTIRFVALEAVLDPSDVATVREALDRARARRTGQRVDLTLMDALAEADSQDLPMSVPPPSFDDGQQP